MSRPPKRERTTLGSSEARCRAYYRRFLPAMQPTYHQKHTHRGTKSHRFSSSSVGSQTSTHERPTNNHCVGLPRPGLAVREDADVVAVECRPEDRFHFFKHILCMDHTLEQVSKKERKAYRPTKKQVISTK
jgi:hypothetical protein